MGQGRSLKGDKKYRDWDENEKISHQIYEMPLRP